MAPVTAALQQSCLAGQNPFTTVHCCEHVLSIAAFLAVLSASVSIRPAGLLTGFQLFYYNSSSLPVCCLLFFCCCCWFSILSSPPSLTVQLSLPAAVDPTISHIPPLLLLQGHHPQPHSPSAGNNYHSCCATHHGYWRTLVK